MTLADHRQFLDTLVESFGAVLDLELTILSAYPMARIAGTNLYKEMPNIWKESYTRQVVETGEPIVALDTSSFTKRIKDFQYADSYSIILYPILLQEKVEGVIVIASFTPRQQQVLLEKRHQLCAYMEKTAELITAKLEQELLLEQYTVTNQQLKGVMESVRGGLVLYSLKRGILQINEIARKHLRMHDAEAYKLLLEDLIRLVNLEAANSTLSERQIHRSFADGWHSLIVQVRPVEDVDESYLCIIQPFVNIQNTITQNTGAGDLGGEDIVASSRSMLTLISRVSTVARHSSNILILGESGTGKELFARMIHTRSERRNHPFVSINCAAIPETLLESELFGYEEGAFTGARKGGRIGKFQLANNGTLFLDEIGDMPLYLQAKLLRVLNDKKIDRIGSSAPIDVDVHIIAATNRDLEQMIESKEFREDLYYRLNVIPFNIPPLRERRDDILALARHFINKYNVILKKEIHWMTNEVMNLLMEYDWPGNVRELQNAVEYMVTFEPGTDITMESVPAKLRVPQAHQSTKAPAKPQLVRYDKPLRELLQEREREILQSMKAAYGGRPNKNEVGAICAVLKISQATYYRKLAELQPE